MKHLTLPPKRRGFLVDARHGHGRVAVTISHPARMARMVCSTAWGKRHGVGEVEIAEVWNTRAPQVIFGR
jgi:hypothetical protein